MYPFENRQEMEQSFKEFAMRPENRELLEKHQQEEVSAALQLQEQMQELKLQQEVSGLDPVDQKLLAPVLRSPVLRQLLVALSASTQQGPRRKVEGAGAQGLSSWLSNPRVLQLLREAAKALRKGLLSEDQLASLLQQQVKAQQLDSEDAPGTQPSAAPHQAQLPSQLLVEALNEHLAERNTGNRAYQQQQFDLALHHYQRALAVVNFVVGQSAQDQAEVDHNKATVLLNIAAVHMARKEWYSAVQCCDEALAVSVSDQTTAKAWLRRAKANVGCHEYEAALCDLQKVQMDGEGDEELTALKSRVLAAQREAAQTVDKQLATRMLGQ